MVAHCDRVFRISLTVRRERICRGCRGVGKHLFYDTTKDEFMPERTLIPQWRLMARLLVLPHNLKQTLNHFRTERQTLDPDVQQITSLVFAAILLRSLLLCSSPTRLLRSRNMSAAFWRHHPFCFGNPGRCLKG